MSKFNFSDSIAQSMASTLASPDFKEIFSPAATLEKLAFKRVSEENSVGDLEAELLKSASAPCTVCQTKSAGAVDCSCSGTCQGGKCEGSCSCGCVKTASTESESLLKNAFSSLLKISDTLDAAGFEKEASDALLLADAIIVQAKKKAKKEDKKEDKNKTDKSDKADKSKAKGKEDKKSDKKDKEEPKGKMSMKDKMKMLRDKKDK